MANRVNPINPADVNMKVNIAGVEFNNPVTVASGTFGSGMEYCEYVDLNKLGAVTTKGVANVPWPGNPTPRIAETYGGMINAIVDSAIAISSYTVIGCVQFIFIYASSLF